METTSLYAMRLEEVAWGASLLVFLRSTIVGVAAPPSGAAP